MTSLNDYLQDAQRLMREQRQVQINPADLIAYINRARREVAMRTQCCRVLTPITGPVVSASIVTAGSGYSATPTVTITTPDFPSGAGANPTGAQATASAIVSGGSIANVVIDYGGDGYFEPVGSIVDASGSGATITFTTQTINQLNQGQEVYNFADIDLSRTPGAAQVLAIKSVSVIYSNYRYSLPQYSFSTYQAQIRTYPMQYQYVPAFFSQYGQGTSGSLYFFPIPSQTYQVEFDCFVIPQDLTTNLSVELIPMPWNDAVVFLALHYGYMSMQNMNISKFFYDLYEKMCLGYSSYARVSRGVNPYGRY